MGVQFLIFAVMLLVFAAILSGLLLWPRSHREEIVHAVQHAMHPRQYSPGERLIGGVSLGVLVCCILILAWIWVLNGTY